MNTADLHAAAEALRRLPEPTLPPWPPAPLDPIPEPRPVPGRPGWAVIDGDGSRPLGEQNHPRPNQQHNAPITRRPADRGGNQGEKEPKK